MQLVLTAAGVKIDRFSGHSISARESRQLQSQIIISIISIIMDSTFNFL